VSEANPFDSILERILEGQAPPNVRAAAARGALPLPRTSLIQLYVVLLKDEDAEIRKAAEASLEALSQNAVLEVLEEPSCRPEVLVHFAKSAARQESFAERIAFHQQVPAAALTVLAAAGSAPVIELVLTNQERLLAQPVLLEQLMLNPALRADQRGRILELLDRVAKRSERLTREGRDGPEEDEGTEEAFAEAARLLDVDVGDLLSASEITDGEEFAESEIEEIRDAYKKIITLNTAQKAILAMKGGREERMILVRDTNKVVALAVLKNGRLNEAEVEYIAKMRNVSDEVLRNVGTNRNWVKNYPVVLALVNNPRTPQGISANFIPRLTTQHLKHLAFSREVPEMIRRNARRTYDIRTKPQTRTYKRK
jgi:hypothetical protein